MSSLETVPELCRLGLEAHDKGAFAQARRLLLKAWQAAPGDVGVAEMLAQAHRAEALWRHREQGCNGKMLFVMRGYFLSYFLPLLRHLPPDKVDLHTGDDAWGVSGEAEEAVRQLGFRLDTKTPQQDWRHYAAVVADHAIQMWYPLAGSEDVLPANVVYISHATAVTGSANHPYQSHCIYSFEGLAQEQKQIAPWQQCLFSGPYQFEEEDIRFMREQPHALRRKALTELDLEDRAGPLVVCYSSRVDNYLEVSQGLRSLAERLYPVGGVVVLKPFPDDLELYRAQDLGRTILWDRPGAGGNILRLAADCVLCGCVGSTLITAFLIEQRILPYHTEMERELQSQPNAPLVLHPRNAANAWVNPRGRAIIEDLGHSCSLADTDALAMRLETLLTDAGYAARAEGIRRNRLGRSNIMGGARTTADILLNLIP